MVVFSIPCTSSSLSFTLHTNKTWLVSSCRASTTSFAAANPTTTTDNHILFSHDLSLRTSWPPRTLFSDQVLIREDNHGLKIKRSSEDEGFKKEVSIAIVRLNTVVERMREMEIQKFMSRTSCDRILMDEQSRDIFNKFLEKPLQYWSSDDGDLEEKLKDVNFLVGVLEKSCPVAVVPSQT